MPDLEQYFGEKFDDMAIPASEGVPEPIPSGRYTLQVEKGEITYTKKGTGVIFKTTFAVIAGPHEGHTIRTQFNVSNPNEQAVTIGIAELKALTAACGLPWEEVRKNSDLLLYKPFTAEVGLEAESINQTTGNPYPPRNRIAKYIMPENANKPAPTGEGGKIYKAKPDKPKVAPVPFKPDDEVPF